jgi:hypothetical protein
LIWGNIGCRGAQLDVLDKYINFYIARLKTLAGKEVDLATWTHISALDALSWFVVSKSPDYTEMGHSGGNTAASDRFWSMFTILGMFPGYIDLMSSIPKVGGYMVITASLMLGLGLRKSLSIMGFGVPQLMSRNRALDRTKSLK